MTTFVHLLAERMENDYPNVFSGKRTVKFSFLTTLERGEKIMTLWEERSRLLLKNYFRRNFPGHLLNQEERTNRERQGAIEHSIDEMCGKKHEWYLIDCSLAVSKIGTTENIDSTVLKAQEGD